VEKSGASATVENTLLHFAYPHIAAVPLADVDTNAVLNVGRDRIVRDTTVATARCRPPVGLSLADDRSNSMRNHRSCVQAVLTTLGCLAVLVSSQPAAAADKPK
jgi:hypothetical protein